MIIERPNNEGKLIKIDLTGPDGNAFALMGYAKQLTKIINKRRHGEYLDFYEIQSEMMGGDYEHVIEVMEKYFGHLIIMYR